MPIFSNCVNSESINYEEGLGRAQTLGVESCWLLFSRLDLGSFRLTAPMRMKSVAELSPLQLTRQGPGPYRAFNASILKQHFLLLAKTSLSAPIRTVHALGRGGQGIGSQSLPRALHSLRK